MKNVSKYLRENFEEAFPNITELKPFLSDYKEAIISKFLNDVAAHYIFEKFLKVKNFRIDKSEREKLIYEMDNYADTETLDEIIKTQLSRWTIILDGLKSDEDIVKI